MRRDLAADRVQCIRVAGGFQRNYDADFAKAVGYGVVDVIGDDAMRDFEAGGAAQGHVLADGGYGIGERVGDRAAAGVMRALQRLDVSALLDRHGGDGASERLELLVAGDEVGLGIDLDHHPLMTAHEHGHQALRRDAAGFFRRLGQAFFAQPVDGGLYVAADFGQGVLAVHHAGAGLLAKLLDQRGGDRRHVAILG